MLIKSALEEEHSSSADRIKYIEVNLHLQIINIPKSYKAMYQRRLQEQ
jgi:hypothetical protein